MGTLFGHLPSEPNVCFSILQHFLKLVAQSPHGQTLALTWPQCRGTIYRELEEATQVNDSIKQAATPQT